MGQITAVAASPSSVAPGGTSAITVQATADGGTADRIAHVTVELDGSSGQASVTIPGNPAETLTYSTDSTKRGQRGVVFASADVGTVAVNAAGNGFTYTAPVS